MDQKPTNKVHVHGYINSVRSNELQSGRTSFFINLATKETYKDNTGEFKNKYTRHDINVITDDVNVIDHLEKIQADLENNYENREEKDFKPTIHKASFDGKLITRERTKDGEKYYNQLILSSVEEMKLDVEQEKDEVRNVAEFTGNIAKVDMHDDFAVIRIATHYYVPGEGVDHKGNKRPYHEETSFVETRLNGNYRKEAFKSLSEGAFSVGDLITVRGQMHNNKYQDKNGNDIYKTVVDLTKIELVAKKALKNTEAQAQEPEKKKESKKESSKKNAKEEKPVKKAKSRKKL